MKTKILIVVAVLVVTFGTSIYYFSRSSQDSKTISNTLSDSTLKVYTLEELKQFDGTDSSKPILIGMNGLVYDVSTGFDFYAKGKSYNYLTGKDSSAQLNLIGGKIIEQKYPVVGKLQ